MHVLQTVQLFNACFPDDLAVQCLFFRQPVRCSDDCVQTSNDDVPLGQGLVWADNLTAAKVDCLDPRTIASSLLDGCSGPLLQGIFEQEVGRLDVTMDCVGLMTHSNGLHSSCALAHRLNTCCQ